MVGVNRFTVDDEEPYQPLRVDPAIEQQQADRLAELRSRRDSAAVGKRLGELKLAAEGSDNLLIPLREALRELATVGEVCDALRQVWGTYHPAEAY